MSTGVQVAQLGSAVTAENPGVLRDFYVTVGGLETIKERDDYTLLRDPRTEQTLIVTGGCPAKGVHLELTVESIPEAVAVLVAAGGTLIEEWERAALCADPEGNDLLLLA